ncbi:calcitonin gene-related peptide type 1 receptor isoform X2 [Aricia agestis]|uniref:calcitonin gene-related peptide type 1 receptor isoform X2 n=1 Tax=Aricia agestis TaxID=91739 RepID=UPI001C203C49|nr:calcitonin gene-related peptide type 1 receptor isoform X2 [Aricia agestis]
MDDQERIEREGLACELVNNSTEPPAGVFCPGTFDTWACWPHTRAGETASAPCPAFVPGFSPELFAHKECMANGSWWLHPDTGRPWSNYTTCVKPEDDMTSIIAVFEAGYSISLVALLLSLGILFYFRSLRCARITVHMNLFASFALNNALWLAWYGFVVASADTVAANPAWCRALNATLQYALLTNYTWMLCEGVYLHTVLVSAFVSERRLLRALLAVGWLLPLPSAIVNAWRRTAAGDEICWADEGAPPLELAVIVCVAVLLNLAFLCNIVRVLCTKLRAGGGAGPSRPSATALHALRATCLLAPLLGLQYLLTPFRPQRTASWYLLYEYSAALTTSLQGLCVAILYCFCNGEVLAQLRRRWRVLTFRPRANSTTNTTVSFVRSAAPGAGEEKV